MDSNICNGNWSLPSFIELYNFITLGMICDMYIAMYDDIIFYKARCDIVVETASIVPFAFHYQVNIIKNVSKMI